MELRAYTQFIDCIKSINKFINEWDYIIDFPEDADRGLEINMKRCDKIRPLSKEMLAELDVFHSTAAPDIFEQHVQKLIRTINNIWDRPTLSEKYQDRDSPCLELDLKFQGEFFIATDDLNELLQSIENNIRSKDTKPLRLAFNSLSEVFVSPEAYQAAIEALMNVQPPIISETKDYLLSERKKSALAAWVEVLKYRGKIKPVPNTLLSKLLNKEFKNLNLGEDGSTLNEPGQTAYKKYYTPLLLLIK